MIGHHVTFSVFCLISSVKYFDDNLFGDFLRVCGMVYNLFSKPMYPVCLATESFHMLQKLLWDP